MRLTPSIRAAVVAVAAFIAYGCATSAPPPVKESDTMRGVASWYGEEFAGRTTANGEIFDPATLTAAHRTLPFGTLLDIVNPKTGGQVRVRVNDRGPYIGNRVIDLSYAAAKEIGLIEPGIGEVEIRIVRLGRGDREPPAPLDVTVASEASAEEPARTAVGDPPPVPFPIPGSASEPVSTESIDVTVDRVEVQEERAGIVSRKQVSADGRTIERAPMPGAVRVEPSGFFVQVGAFSVEANARALQRRLVELGEQAWVASGDLFRVRIGPFATREEATTRRSALEASGISALIVAE